mmetsp:Transcript_65263/g.126005  ORF Transcript_65263/g.126005 Transcript_65263/m.126005 type:complete len:260 (-) Transcript_65263:79-858(-)
MCCLRKKWARVIGRQSRGPWNLWVECVCKSLLLHNRPAYISPAIQCSSCCSSCKSRNHVLRQLVRDHGCKIRLVKVKSQEEATCPQELPDLHASIANHEAIEATGFQDVLCNVSGTLELSFLVQLRSKLDVFQRRNSNHLWHCTKSSSKAFADRRTLRLRFAIQCFVDNRLHEELYRSRNRCPRHLSNKTLLHETHHAMCLEEARERLASSSAWVRHTDGADDIDRVHDNAGDQRPATNRRQGVEAVGFALAVSCHCAI